ncbi:MAG TPA: alpha/beta hydrolase [Longimicrobiales bacterium]
MTEPLLHHDRVAAAEGAAPGCWLFVLHGIYGAGRNWSTVMRRVVRERPDWGAELVDLREHGGSRGFAPPHTLAAAADDVWRLARHLGVGPDAILGHSFGGKVALLYARRHGGVRQLWVVDSTPAARSPDGSAVAMLAVLRRTPGPFPSRDAAVRALEREGIERPVAQWMATNVEPADGVYRWRLDLDVMQALLDDFFRTDLWDVVESPPVGLDLHFVKAERSSVLDAAACARIEAAGRRTGRVFLHRVSGGHWLNADNPAALVELLTRSLPGAETVEG